MASIDGLGSGLNTSTIITQLMALERMPQQRLQLAQSNANFAGSAWGRLEGAMKVLSSLTRSMTSPLSTLSQYTATSSAADLLGVTAGLGARPATHTVTVNRLATAQQLTASGLLSRDAVVGAGTMTAHTSLAAIGATGVDVTAAVAGSYDVEVTRDADGELKVLVNGAERQHVVSPDGRGLDLPDLGLSFATLGPPTPGKVSVTVVRTGEGATAADLAKAVNDAKGRLSATLIDTGMGQTTLSLTGTATGAPSNVTVSVTGMTGLPPVSQQRAAVNAALEVNGVAVERPANTINDLLPGLSFSLAMADPLKPVTVRVADDDERNSAAVKSLVDAVNSVLREVSTSTKWDPVAKKAGPLTGDAGARSLSSQLLAAVSAAGGSVAGLSLGAVGIDIQRDGTYTLDAAKFTKARTDNPEGVSELLKALATGAGAVAKASLETTGAVTLGKDRAGARAGSLQKQIEGWDVRLELVRTRLTKQFTSLESALGSLRSQGNWLAGQLNALPKMYSN